MYSYDRQAKPYSYDRRLGVSRNGVIRREDGEYCVRSPNNPDWNGGCYKSKEKAEERLREVEYFKRQGRKDKLPGGLADKKDPEDFDQKQLEKGRKVEMEHTDDKDLALEIAMDHLTEDPDYYRKLSEMEGEDK